MPSTEIQLELQAKYIDVSVVLQPCGLPTDLGSPAVSQTAVYANGLMPANDRWDLIRCLKG